MGGEVRAEGRGRAQRWWAIPILIVLVVLVGYGIAPTRLPLVGEETCRIQHGVEMAQTGDWLIATNQGVPILDRPPLQYWTLALVHRFVRELDPLTARTLAALFTLATGLVCWWYARGFVGPAGAMLAGVAYPTTGHIFDLGRRAETDGLFALLMAGSLLVWHHGYARGRGMLWTWIVAASIAALATLTKGLQGPITFFGAVGLFLLLRRDWRTMLHWSAPVGLGVFLGLIAVWQVPFWLEAGWEGTRTTWLTPATHRVGFDVGALLAHLALFPLAVFLAAMPWSPLLLALLDPRMWRLDERTRSALGFCLCGIVVILVPVWVTSDGHHRYTIAAYPLIGVVGGIVADRCLSLDLSYSLRRFWRDFARIFVITLFVATAGVAVATVVAPIADTRLWRTLAQPWWSLAIVVPAIGVLGVLVYRRAGLDRSPAAIGVPAGLAMMMAIFFNGPVLTATVANAEDVGPRIAELRERLPEGAELVSFGPVFHKFVYWWGEPIPIHPWRPGSASEARDWPEYFAITVRRGREIDFPFEYETLAWLNMDRTRQEIPENAVLVGRRLGAASGEGGPR
jgi:4-amino-4-deoxy-L-arabinose transferase-like glycosyltransferase